jgi:CheY-like chemotaxis protein
VIQSEKSLDIDAVVIVDNDILSRHAIADYLRKCGYDVVEAANTDEAVIALQHSRFSVDIVLCDIRAVGTKSGFELAAWVRQNHPDVDIQLAGSLTGIIEKATDICESRPNFTKPYEPQSIVNYIKRLRAARERAAQFAPKPS